MTYTFKLSRRLARLRDASLVVPAVFVISSCTGDPSTGPESTGSDPNVLSVAPGSVFVSPNQAMQFQATLDNASSATMTSDSRKGKGHGRRTVVDVAVVPGSVTVVEGSAANFVANATLSDGSTAQPSVSWSATGGTIDTNGKYTAGPIPGAYAVRATASNGVADTAEVVVTQSPPTVTVVTVSPTTAELPVGGSKRFLAVGTSSDGSTVAVNPKYVATGGTISADGTYQAGQTPGDFQVVATDTLTNLADTAAVIIDPPTATLQAVVLTPATASLITGANQQFSASGQMSDGSSVPLSPSFSATGGSISTAGEYTAGNTAGSYRVIATDQASGRADTASIAITAAAPVPPPAPTLAAIVLTPTSASLTSGGTQLFTASGKMSDGSTSQVQVAWSASGGTISSGGLYSAGQTAGTFRVIAVDITSKLADTSTVNIQAPVTPPPPSSSGSCVRAVNVSALGALTSALTVALPGDCINLAAGTYSLTSPLRINRSGTASQPITIQGTGSNTVINLQQQEMTFESASYVHLRNMRLTNFPLRGLWLNGASDYNVLDSLEIDHTQHEAVSPKGTSSHNIFQNNWIHDTGIAAPQWGEGFYVGGDDASGTPLYGVTDNQILNNRIGPNVRAQSVDISEGADRTVVRGNVINGMGTQWIPSEGSATLIGVTASGAIIDNNQLQYGSPNGIVFYAPRNYTMTGNVVTNNTIDLQNIHNVTDRAFYGFNLTAGTIEPGRVTLKCNNTVTSGAFSNMACTP